MRFTKMHGIGNDYVYVNAAEEQIEDPSAVSEFVSDRHFGIGADGLIIIRPVPDGSADFEMDMYNADGSRGKMCGNGIRCVAKYVYDHGMTNKTELRILTGSGIKTLQLQAADGKMTAATVDMGRPITIAKEVPAAWTDPEAEVFDQPYTVDGTEYRISLVSMGNPHCVVPVEDVAGLDIEKIGPKFENDPLFPERVNTEFIRVIDRKNVEMRVWERGSGETLACGTGSCAVTTACYRNGWTDPDVTIHLLGGDLRDVYDTEKNTVFMTGPATTVFEGDIELPAGIR